MRDFIKENKLNTNFFANTSKLLKPELKIKIQQFLARRSAKEIIRYFVGKYGKRMLQRKCELLRAATNHYRNMCVNHTDFFTLEPLENIPDNQLYCVCENNFWYGFNVFSLFSLVKRRHTSHNPYSRVPFSEDVRNNVLRLIRLMSILEKDVVNLNEMGCDSHEFTQFVPPQQSHRFLGNSIYPAANVCNEAQRYLIERLVRLRQNSLEQRVTELFADINTKIRNTTQDRWFFNLSNNDCVRLFHNFQYFWLNEPTLTDEVRWKICSLTGNPFYNIIIHNFSRLQRQQILEAVLLVMENMVYTGVDVDSRETGAFQVMIHLLSVSNDARRAIPWF